MKICVISTPIFQVPCVGYSGLEHLAWQIAEGLGKKGHQVSLVAPEGSHCDHAQIISTGPPGRVSEEQAYSTYWQQLPGFDVIIDHSWQKWSHILKQEGRLPQPVLSVLHAPVNTMYRELPPTQKPSFVCISKDQGEHLKALFSVDCRVSHNGVDMDFYKPLNIGRNGQFLFLARFSSIKGPDLAIDACQRVGVGLDMVGDTSITGEPELLKSCIDKADECTVPGMIKKKAWKKGSENGAISIHGGKTRGECVYWMSKSHCLVHANMRFREPFGLAPIEAMACGLPVIAFDNGAMRETVKHGETGVLVKSMDDLIDTIDHARRDISKPYRDNCREWASQFSLSRMIDRYEELCTEAINTGGW